jgi:hypothetical protein
MNHNLRQFNPDHTLTPQFFKINFNIILPSKTIFLVSRDSSVGTVTDYGLDGRGSISGRGKKFFSLWPTQPPIQEVPGGGVFSRGLSGRARS